MSGLWARIDRRLAEEARAGLVTVLTVKGSAPREAGARMMVQADGRFSGTIGGGALEWQALAEAQKLLRRPTEGRGIEIVQALGPDLGQCCGGQVRLLIEAFAAEDRGWIAPLAAAEAAGPIVTRARRDARGIWRREMEAASHLDAPASWGRRSAAFFSHPCKGGGGEETFPPGESVSLDNDCLRERFGTLRTPLMLFGAGHVGRALVLALAPLPFAVRWLDARPEAFPAAFPAHVEPVASGDAVGEITAAPTGALVLAMTHSHALDLEIAAAALARPDLSYIGVIGSETKAARFRRQLAALGLVPEAIARLVCPIGVRSLGSKEPAVIAAGVVVELLERRESMARAAARPPARLTA